MESGERVSRKTAMVIGAIAVTAAAIMQDYGQGDSPTFIKIAIWLMAGAAIGAAAAWFMNRNSARH